MAVIDYGKTNQVVSIVNNAKTDIQMTDAGSFTGPFAVSKDEKAYKNGDRFIQFFKSNVYVKIPAGDTLKLITTTSAELAYYMGLANTMPELSVSSADNS